MEVGLLGDRLLVSGALNGLVHVVAGPEDGCVKIVLYLDSVYLVGCGL